MQEETVQAMLARHPQSSQFYFRRRKHERELTKLKRCLHKSPNEFSLKASSLVLHTQMYCQGKHAQVCLLPGSVRSHWPSGMRLCVCVSTCSLHMHASSEALLVLQECSLRRATLGYE